MRKRVYVLIWKYLKNDIFYNPNKQPYGFQLKLKFEYMVRNVAENLTQRM